MMHKPDCDRITRQAACNCGRGEVHRSLVLVKPDAINRGLLGYCIAAFEPQGKILQINIHGEAPLWMLERHYHEHQAKDFYPGLLTFMRSGAIAAVAVDMHWTNARETALSIRRHFRDMCAGPANLVHASDSQRAAEFELSLWFPGLR